MLNTSLAVLFLLSFLSGCAATGPADDGYENSNEWVDSGRLLSGEAKTVYDNSDQQDSKTTNNSAEADYVAYQQWLKSKENNTGEYQKFKKWQEFEAFQTWKKKQKSE